MTQQQETGCVLRLFGAQSTAVGKTVENFPPQWRAAAQWKSRGAETLVALQAQSPSGLKKAAQALRQAFSADLYGAGETTLPAAVVEALERHDKLLICADAAAGALLEARLENLPGAEKVFDFGAVSYANPKTGPLIEKRARARLPKDCTDPLRQALARAQAARRVVGADLSAACAERESDCVLVLSCRKGCFLRTVPAGENPALWLLDIIRRTAANKPQAEGTGFLPARRAAKKDVLPGPQPRRHPLRRVCMTLLVLALLLAGYLAACALLLGLCCASCYGINPMINTLIPMEYERAGRVGLVAGLVDCFIYLGSALAGTAAGALSDGYGWNAVYTVWAFVSALGAALAFVSLRGGKRMAQMVEHL